MTVLATTRSILWRIGSTPTTGRKLVDGRSIVMAQREYTFDQRGNGATAALAVNESPDVVSHESPANDSGQPLKCLSSAMIANLLHDALSDWKWYRHISMVDGVIHTHDHTKGDWVTTLSTPRYNHHDK